MMKYMNPLALKNTFDTLPGGLLITDKQSRVVYASRALERRTGFSVAEIIGKKPGELWGGKMSKPFYQHLWQTIGEEAKPFVGAVKNIKKNGGVNPETLYIAPLKDEQGETCYFAEIHPEFEDQEDARIFGQTFLTRASQFHTEESSFSWIFNSLRKQKDGMFTSVQEPVLGTSFSSLTALFRELLIHPTEQALSRRFEDAPLILAAQQDPKAFARLYEKYAPSVRGYFMRRLEGDSPLSDDLSQEVFARAFRYLPSFRLANASYYTYLLHICHSVLMNHYRKNQQETVSFSDERVSALPDSSAGREQDNIDVLLRSLPAKAQAVMLLKYRDGFRAKEIGEKIGKTENAVKLILSRSRKKLGKMLR